MHVLKCQVHCTRTRIYDELAHPCRTMRLKIVGNEIIKNIGKSESCMVSKLPIISKRTTTWTTGLTTDAHKQMKDELARREATGALPPPSAGSPAKETREGNPLVLSQDAQTAGGYT